MFTKPILLALTLLLVCAGPIASAQTFSISPPAEPAQGVKATDTVLQDTAQDTGKQLHKADAKFARVGPTPDEPPGHSTWKSNIGGIVVKCQSTQTATGHAMQFTIENGLTHRIESLDFQLPQIQAPLAANNRIHSPYRGGCPVEWVKDDWQKGMGNTSLWPNVAFSPILTLWNDTDTLAITYFNKTLTPVMLYWFSGPVHNERQQLNPFLRCHPGLQPGQSVTLSVEYRFMKGGPTAHQKLYRETVLVPFMEELGIPEATGGLGPGPIAMSPWVDRGRVRATLEATAAAGVSTYIQWTPPDASSEYFNPYAPTFAWFEALGVSKTIPGIKHVGVLINPYITPPLKADAYALKSNHRDINLRLNLSAPVNRTYLARLREELVKRNITIAFWDTGGGPDHVHGHEWLKLLAGWKAGGVAIMPESSCDVAAWTTGLWMEYPYTFSTYDVAKTVCPKADLAAHDNLEKPRMIDGKKTDWREDAVKKGIRPIVGVEEFRQRARPAPPVPPAPPVSARPAPATTPARP